MLMVALGVTVNAQERKLNFTSDTVKADTAVIQFTDNASSPAIRYASGVAGFVIDLDTISGTHDIEFDGRISGSSVWVNLADSTALNPGQYEFWDANPKYNDYRLRLLGEASDTSVYYGTFEYKKGQ